MGGGSRRKQQEAIGAGDAKKFLVERDLRGAGDGGEERIAAGLGFLEI